MRIELFLNNLDEAYQISMYRAIRDEVDALGIELVCVQRATPGRYHLEQLVHKRDLERFFMRERVGADGVLALTSVVIQNDNEATNHVRIADRSFPLVSIGARMFDFPSIIVNGRTPMERLLEHLIHDHGYRKLLFLCGSERSQDSCEREAVFRSFINGEINGEVIHGEVNETSGMTLMRDYIAAHPHEPPDAVIAASDTIALGARRTLDATRDPHWKQCALTGFDDIPQSHLELPALTTIHQPFDAMGTIAVRLLRDSIMGKNTPLVTQVEAELCLRNSCGCKDMTWEQRERRRYWGLYCDVHELLQKTTYSVTHSVAQNTLWQERCLSYVSLFGQELTSMNTTEEIIPRLRFFLTNLGVEVFYLFINKQPSLKPLSSSALILKRDKDGEFVYKNPPHINLSAFFAGLDSSVCFYHLRSGNEYIGLIVYDTQDALHPHICSAAIFIANTIKRLLILEKEQRWAKQLEKEVALRTRDLNAEAKRRVAVEAEVLRISELERLRFSLDLHDDICQRLAGISMFARSIASGLSGTSLLPELSDMIDETLQRTRRYAHDSFPVELDTLGLRDALESLCNTINHACRCDFHWSVFAEKSPLSTQQEINVYRIIQEAVQNAVKHSGASRISVEVEMNTLFFIARVRDNGKGDPALNSEDPIRAVNKQSVGLGLRSMRYRAHQLDAEYIFNSTGQGTLVEARVPLWNIRRQISPVKQSG
ncbi:MAG: substrate-binding domain-containing protein [Treponema sp.]|jgi:signal transduction histidine kinase/DNA-binding LacI/PurR family transcriptional regulator|nr:substrate-binding domain-containing protein [Treponema sp.]